MTLAERGVEIGDGRFDAGADVEDAVEIELRGGHVRAHDILHEDVVARLLAGAVDAGLLPVQKRAGEDRHDAGLSVLPLPRTVDVRVTQRHGLDAVDLAEEAEVLIDGQLGAAVRRERRPADAARPAARSAARRTRRRRWRRR